MFYGPQPRLETPKSTDLKTQTPSTHTTGPHIQDRPTSRSAHPGLDTYKPINTANNYDSWAHHRSIWHRCTQKVTPAHTLEALRKAGRRRDDWRGAVNVAKELAADSLDVVVWG